MPNNRKLLNFKEAFDRHTYPEAFENPENFKLDRIKKIKSLQYHDKKPVVVCCVFDVDFWFCEDDEIYKFSGKVEVIYK